MRNRTYGGVRGRKTKVGRKLLRFPPTRLRAFQFPFGDHGFSLYFPTIFLPRSKFHASRNITLAQQLTCVDSGLYVWTVGEISVYEKRRKIEVKYGGEKDLSMVLETVHRQENDDLLL